MRPWTFRGYKGGYKGAIRDARTIQHDMHALRRALVALLQASANGSRQSVASGIAILADAPPEQSKDPMREALAAAGVFPPLVAMLGDGTAEERAAAAEALWKLSRNASNKAAIAAAGAIVTLVALVRDGNAQDKANAAGTLVNLSNGNDAIQAAIAAAGQVGVKLEGGGLRASLSKELPQEDVAFIGFAAGGWVDIKSVLSLGFVRTAVCVKPAPLTLRRLRIRCFVVDAVVLEEMKLEQSSFSLQRQAKASLNVRLHATYGQGTRVNVREKQPSHTST